MSHMPLLKKKLVPELNPLSHSHHHPRARTATSLGKVQFKLAVGAVHDPLEREADAIADAVVRGSADAAGVGPDPTRAATVRRACAACMDEEQTVRRLPLADGVASTGTPDLSAELTREILTRRGQGRPFAAANRAFFEQRMGHAFTGVRIHDDGASSALASRLGARAFTLGNDMFFARGQFNPHTHTGRRLLAHELTHTLQQSTDRAAATTLRRSPDEAEDSEPCPGQTYRIRKGDTLFGIAGKAFGVAAGAERLKHARQINEDSRNLRYHGPTPESEKKLLGERRISFLPRFSCEAETTETTEAAAPGKCYAQIYIPGGDTQPTGETLSIDGDETVQLGTSKILNVEGAKGTVTWELEDAGEGAAAATLRSPALGTDRSAVLEVPMGFEGTALTIAVHAVNGAGVHRITIVGKCNPVLLAFIKSALIDANKRLPAVITATKDMGPEPADKNPTKKKDKQAKVRGVFREVFGDPDDLKLRARVLELLTAAKAELGPLTSLPAGRIFCALEYDGSKVASRSAGGEYSFYPKFFGCNDAKSCTKPGADPSAPHRGFVSVVHEALHTLLTQQDVYAYTGLTRALPFLADYPATEQPDSVAAYAAAVLFGDLDAILRGEGAILRKDSAGELPEAKRGPALAIIAVMRYVILPELWKFIDSTPKESQEDTAKSSKDPQTVRERAAYDRARWLAKLLLKDMTLSESEVRPKTSPADAFVVQIDKAFTAALLPSMGQPLVMALVRQLLVTIHMKHGREFLHKNPLSYSSGRIPALAESEQYAKELLDAHGSSL